ncbi:hypothetical protein [Chryseobacterium sp. R2A-55]|nr:hypothetical protein [Chryseobacterium sp. R2A-55]
MKKLISLIPYRKHSSNVIKYYLHVILLDWHFDFHFRTDFNH